MKRWWPPWRRAEDKTDEALEQLRQLAENDPEIKRLAAELREVQRRNHFSSMVDAAIHRRIREEGA